MERCVDCALKKDLKLLTFLRHDAHTACSLKQPDVATAGMRRPRTHGHRLEVLAADVNPSAQAKAIRPR